LAVSAVFIASILILTGCDEEHPSPTVVDEAKRRDAALIAVVQCFIDHNVIPKAHLNNQPWLQDGKVKPAVELVTWASDHAESTYRGKYLRTWEDEATAAWPNWTCPL
jgi:hypothetical protein